MPSNRRSLLSQRLLALITDEWQDTEEFMERAIPLVPPGQAKREYEARRVRLEASRQKRAEEGKPLGPRRPEPTYNEALRMGARAIVNSFIGDARDRRLVEVEVGENRFDRRLRLSDERRWAHHCCMHGGTCRGGEERQDPPEEPDEEETPLATLIEKETPLATLIQKVLESRREREERPRPVIREVFPGDIDRLLRECG